MVSYLFLRFSGLDTVAEESGNAKHDVNKYDVFFVCVTKSILELDQIYQLFPIYTILICRTPF